MRGAAAEIERLDAHAQPLFEAAAQPLAGVGAAHRRARQHDAGELAAAEPILVIHRRLMHEIGQVAVGLELPRAEENQVACRGRSPACVVGRDVHDQQVPESLRRPWSSKVAAGSRPTGQDGVDQVQRRQIDDARPATPASAHALCSSR